MTSNIGSQYYQDNRSREEIQALVRQEVSRHFRPEFINRLDEMIIFNKLTQKDIEKIVDLQLQDLRKRLAPRNIELDIDPAVREKLAETGFDPDFGVRPLRRLIQREIQDALAMKLLQGTVREGSTILIEMGQDGNLLFAPVSGLKLKGANNAVR
jgi:ATP-dependent Clp protease ATP-binding subunit ClpB